MALKCAVKDFRASWRGARSVGAGGGVVG